jgi:hypothetical protein
MTEEGREGAGVWLERMALMGGNLNSAAAKLGETDEYVKKFHEMLSDELDNFSKIKYGLGTIEYEAHLRRQLAEAERLLGKIENDHGSIKLDLKKAQFVIMRSRAKNEGIEEEEQ